MKKKDERGFVMDGPGCFTGKDDNPYEDKSSSDSKGAVKKSKRSVKEILVGLNARRSK
jgi:hypothetical protein